MQKIRLGNLLHCLTLVPLVALICFGAILAVSSFETYREVQQARRLQVLVDATTAFSATAIPNEGRAAYPYLASGEADARAKMQAQWPLTDAAFARIDDASKGVRIANAETAALLQSILDQRAILADVRERALRRETDRSKMGAFLQNSSNLGNELVGRLAGAVDNSDIARSILALHAALEISTGSLNEGGRGEIAFQTGKLSQPLFRVMHRGVELQQIFGRQFETFAPTVHIAQYKSFLASDDVQLINRVRPVLLDAAFDKLDPKDAAGWTKADQARRAFWLKEIEAMRGSLAAQTTELLDSAYRSFLVYTATSVAIILLAVGLAAYVSRVIRSLFGQLASSMTHIAEGTLETVVPFAGRADEIGRMAAALDVFRSNALKVREREVEERAELRARAERAQVMSAVVESVSGVVQRAADGDFSGRVQIKADDPALTALIDGINQINIVVDEATGEFERVLTAIAEGDLTLDVRRDYGGRLDQLKSAINATANTLGTAVGTIQQTAHEVQTSSTEIKTGADDLARRTEQQAVSLEETAATTEQLAASVKSTARSSKSVVTDAQAARSVASEGGMVITQAVSAMSQIEATAIRVAAITNVIEEIAFQTNLLALNAAVEAARAGDAGRGFAVVAAEVRTLAQRAADAAKDIGTLIASSTVEVEQGVKLVREAGDTLTRIVEASSRVVETISQIAVACDEQASGIDEVSQVVAHMDEMTQQNAALSEQSSASALALAGQIERLNDLVTRFRTSSAERVKIWRAA
ncbi:methyl-accepting chemotaxis protein [Bosea sp. BE271]|nr:MULTISPECIES: methyl-accepting chemotaxis protein [Bosea]MDR6830534.1 methyl-accepting chemotaxis protein [Bosea robiniae]MDR6897415.1 methyl-accepting chemotaxis protein [Bosea sp. BE109]MDR7140812.1 methyl-accepting chemotaxis protein [Bosea sp. BE168]MDR7177445.1 methyl-accepting chemotaxis protein [Bosea sp. BE271]